MGDSFGVLGSDPIFVAFRITGRQAESGGVRYRMRRLEDTIHPVSLHWDVPLIGNATNKVDFNRHWEKLTYAFDLPDPADFPKIDVNAAERATIERFISTCETLSGYSVFNDKGGEISIRLVDGEFIMEADLPSHEVFTGLSATFRQLHSHREEASYDKVVSILGRPIGQLPTTRSTEIKRTLELWNDSRRSLKKFMLETLVCDKILKGHDRRGQKITMEGVHPEVLLRAFNYGDSLHWGKEKEHLADLLEDPTNEQFYRFCVTDTMITIGHFYFGFSKIALAALGRV